MPEHTKPAPIGASLERSHVMKGRIAVVVAVAVGFALSTAFASTASAVTPKKKTIAFTASYSGTANAQVTDNVAEISANGSGTGTLIAASKITGAGKGDTSMQPCVPFSGPGSLVGAGTKLTFTVISGSQGCGDEAGQVFSISGKAKVTGATGKLKKATGTLKFTGIYDRGAGTFTVKFKGTLTQ
jgi:hypothetical protein